MSGSHPRRVKLQATIYLVEVATLCGMLALAASSSTGFALGPVGRLLVAFALPLPCHLLLAAHLVFARRATRLRAATLRVEPLPPVPVPTPAPTG